MAFHQNIKSPLTAVSMISHGGSEGSQELRAGAFVDLLLAIWVCLVFYLSILEVHLPW